MNVTLAKRLPTFLLKLKDAKPESKFKIVNFVGLFLTLKRLDTDNKDFSLEINLSDTIIDLTNKSLIVQSKYSDPTIINLSDFEVDQINVILLNYLNLLQENITAINFKDLESFEIKT